MQLEKCGLVVFGSVASRQPHLVLGAFGLLSEVGDSSTFHLSVQ